ncbi:MAG TPA: hypothetical protein VHE30_25840 [Polyangiaceae bacterium]|nr:hypothetical protein [Polyangiaceae bacterium]
MSVPFRTVVLFVGSVVSVACTTGPDVVASRLQESNDDGGPLLHPPPAGPLDCNPGTYEGTFRSQSIGATRPAFTVNGTFTFRLEKSPQGEFYELADDSVLKGTSAQGSFSANITGTRACVAAEFNSRIVDGNFAYITSTMNGQDNTIAFPFDGEVHGYYNPPPDGSGLPAVFTGTWIVHTSTSGPPPADGGVDDRPVLSGGTWGAYLIAP